MKQAAVLLGVLAISLLAGCAAPSDSDNGETGIVNGAFTQDRSNADLQDFDQTVKAHGVKDYALMESLPEQFRIELPFTQCESLYFALEKKPYLSGLSATCVPVR